MKITILTLFPEMFQGPFTHSIVKRAQEDGKLIINFVNIRDFGISKHKMVDDTPYGGGVGMVMRVDVIDSAITHARDANAASEKVILMDARGKTYTQRIAKSFAYVDHLIIVCGHYEGVDERVRSLVDDTISIGDFIVTGGEIPAMLITDSVARLVEGVLDAEATDRESFSLTDENDQHLEYPQYTKPQAYNDMAVPDVLLSGNHAKIREWRTAEAKRITKKHRPDLLADQKGDSAEELAG